MTTYVEVAVNLPVAMGMFHYHLPPELEGRVTPGSLVVVPFGQKQVQGVIWRMLDAPDVPETKAVAQLLDPEPALTPVQLALAAWMAHETLAPLAACFDLMLPPGLSQQVDILYQLNPPAVPSSGLGPLQTRLINLLKERGPLRGRQIDSYLQNVNWRAAAGGMKAKGWLATQAVLMPPSVRPKQVRSVRLAIPPEEIDARLEAIKTNKKEIRARRRGLLEFLAQQTEPVEPAWAIAGSGGALPADLQRLAEAGLVVFGESEAWRDPLDRIEFTLSEPPVLTNAQTGVWEQVQGAIARAALGETLKPHILHGITSSGKTEIYLQAVAETLRRGRQAIVLVPEIALTPQTVRRFAARFPGQVGLVHSRLSPGERYDTWRRARSGDLPVIVGPRSALFTPLPNLGLIVVDEFHEETYYQDDFPPAYNAVEAALALGRFSRALVLLGSATPDVTLMQRAERESWPMLSLPARILAHRQAVEQQFRRLGISAPNLPLEGESAALELPKVRVVDMRQELKAGNRTIFSRALQQSIEEVLAAGQQAILFLNRRGTSTYVFCRECGATVACPRCDLPLTYHAGPDLLICHTCNYRRKMPAKCPACGSAQIRQLGLGTERVESEVQARFPGARTLRWDAETTRQKDAHDLILGHFSAQRADILIGTQMIAKGLDLPLVTLVGVILADVGLQLPDFRAGERAFQLLTQVAGRAGRSPLGGRVILQTYLPGNYAIQAASRHDYPGFLRLELDHRRKLGYPPFSRLARLEMGDADPRRAEQEAQRMGRQVEAWLAERDFRATSMIGPAPCFFSRQNGLYRWQIILRGPDPASVLRGRSLGEWRAQIDPLSLL
jgi:primosomal protein N' (replication factor Y)